MIMGKLSKRDSTENYQQDMPEKLRNILIDMEENDERVRPFSGSIAYSGFIRADYRIRLQMGFKDKHSMKDTKEI